MAIHRETSQRFNCEVGLAIKAIREKRGVLQAELGKKVGFTARWVSRIELGHRPLSLLMAVRIADALEVGIEKIVGMIDTREDG